ncbi:TetR/AcrR family transcriptional regulator [Iamia sp.]|uniref:TetR/AcrR family transcriptional regulator n=1 Tax=Iamia sp. TaxID=2722710 RepID=UPI002BC720DE|nr:TetR/AcrR family transcriptional regulator [Iamia sp.]HXH57322.1 TetR/AcrR family transcriptional regulator [Iamia sp.]
MASGPDRRRGSRRPPQERREAFLDAAVVAIRRDGPTVSMEAMARQAGVTKPILYRLFDDRDGLLHALGERMAGQVIIEVTAALEQGSDGDPREMLRRAISAYVALIDDETEVYRFVTDQSGPRGPTVTGLSAEVARAIAVVLGEQLRAAGADSGAAEPWAFGIVGMVHLSGDWWVRNRTLPRDRLVTYLVDLLWDGFAGLAPPNREPRSATTTD